MKRWLIRFSVFLSAVVLGVSAAWLFLVEKRREVIVKLRPEQGKIAIAEPAAARDQFPPEFFNLPDYDILQFPDFPGNFVDLNNTGGLVRKSEIVARNGERWLVMFERVGKYAIEPSTARVRQLKTVSYPGDENDAQLSFDIPGQPVFAFRGVSNIKPGPVETVYLRPTGMEIERKNLPIEAMKSGFKRELNLNENWYTLRVSQGLDTKGTKVGVLVLETGGVQQIVARNYFESDYGTIIGDLLWAGDIDNDGRLDLYLDEFNEKGYFAGGLYLSSHAGEGELVKLVGVFSFGGC